MTIRDLYDAALIEINKLEAPSLLLEDYNYFINKAIQQYINLKYNLYDTSQQSSDDLRVLKTTTILEPKKLDKLDFELLVDTYYVDLPLDYLHLLNCVVEFNRVGNNSKCAKSNALKISSTAQRLTADMYGGIIKNYYHKPSYKRPYYYINNISGVDDSILSDNRSANPSNVRLELRFGDDSLYVPSKVYIEYIKAPMYVGLSQEEIISPIDTSQILEFPDYVCYEILNLFVRLLMENASDPRLVSNVPINQTIGLVNQE